MWHCSCGIINAGLIGVDCAAAKSWKHVEHYQISDNSLDALRIWVALDDLKKELSQSMTQQEELFATYYNRGKILVKDMDDVTLREHREQLAKITVEAKASLLSADDEIRERAAKKGSKEWLVTTDTSTSVSDAINVPKQRRERMSKMDKLRTQLAAYLDEDTVNETIKNLEKRATDKNLKTVTFQKKTTETAAVQVKAPESNGKAFDPSTLKFGK